MTEGDEPQVPAVKCDAFNGRIDFISAHSRLHESGRLMLDESTYRISGYPPVKVDLFADWTANPLGQRSWQWGTAAFNFLPWLIAHHATSGNPDAIHLAVEAVRSWKAAATKQLKSYEFLNHDHATAVRGENVMLLIVYLARNGLYPDYVAELVPFADEIATKLESESFYSRHTNHGLEQARILALAADLLPGSPALERRWSIAVERLTDELRFAFTTDGVHVENSPGYHQYVCDSFLKIADVLPDSRIAKLNAAIDEVMPKAMGFLAHVMRPDAKFPIIGDTGAKWAVNPFQRYAGTPEYEWIEHVVSQRQRGKAPPSIIATYPEAGYAVVRDRWKPGFRKGREYHAIMKCGFKSTYHRHDDDFNIVMVCGEDWLIDGGLFCYAEDHPVRRYLRSKWAHNVPVIDDGSDRWPRFRSVMHHARMVTRIDGEELHVEAESAGYPGYEASRVVHFQPRRRRFVVRDSLLPTTQRGPVTFRSLWHVPATRDIYRRGQSILVRSRKNALGMVIRNRGPGFDKVGLFRPGLEHYANAVVSWQANRLVPAKIVAFSTKADSFESHLQFDIIEAEDLTGWEKI